MSTNQQLPPPAWYVDPHTPDQLRYWDGVVWTPHVAPLDTIADMHTGHFESIRQIVTSEMTSSPRGSTGTASTQVSPRRGLGLADAARGVHVSRRSAGEAEIRGESVEFEPPALDDGWFVSEGLSIGPERVILEHVVVGTPGVFLLMSRDHSGSEVWAAERSLLVDGHTTDYLREARDAGRALSRMIETEAGLRVVVEPVIVIKAKDLTVKAQPLDAHVIASSLLGRWFMRLEPVFDSNAVAKIIKVVEPEAGSATGRSGSDRGAHRPSDERSDNSGAHEPAGVSAPRSAPRSLFGVTSDASDDDPPAPRRSLFS